MGHKVKGLGFRYYMVRYKARYSQDQNSKPLATKLCGHLADKSVCERPSCEHCAGGALNSGRAPIHSKLLTLSTKP